MVEKSPNQTTGPTVWLPRWSVPAGEIGRAANAGLRAYLPLVVFILILIIGWSSAAFVWVASRNAERIRFTADAEEATNRIRVSLDRHISAIHTTAALFEAQSGRVGPASFGTFFEKMRLGNAVAGGAGLGYLGFTDSANRDVLEEAVQRLSEGAATLWPANDEPFSAAILLYRARSAEEPELIGYDAYSDPVRRAAIDHAIGARDLRATAPLKLLREAEQPQPGIILYAPVYAPNFGISAGDREAQLPTGFVFGGFSSGELLRATLDVPPLLPLNLVVRDVQAPAEPLHIYGRQSSAQLGRDFAVVRTIPVAGREWRLTYTPSAAFDGSSSKWLAYLLGLAAFMLALAAAALLREQARAHATADALATALQNNLLQKDLMLQEMKHRIKNAIARILAIARQTAARSEDLPGFTVSFTQRLQAMSNAQEMLTRSAWMRADLQALLAQELGQVFGPELDQASLTGPAVDLDEKTTQALGLTFHELATNALKHGGPRDGLPQIDVAWRLARVKNRPAVLIDWTETGGSNVEGENKPGFGTKLMDANIRHELGGAIERTFSATGLHVRLTVPL